MYDFTNLINMVIKNIYIDYNQVFQQANLENKTLSSVEMLCFGGVTIFSGDKTLRL